MIHTVDSLRAFEARVAEAYTKGQIRAPIHLSGGNEEQLIRYFAANYRPGDWVFSTWRSHYHAILAGVPEQDIFDQILAGRSITLTFPEHNFLTSAIVAGTLPIAVGVALGLARKYENYSSITPKVHCLIGDMAARTGAFHEAREYAIGQDLPITFVIEDNGLSVTTDTNAVWGGSLGGRALEADSYEQWLPIDIDSWYAPSLKTYRYRLTHPHAGIGVRINF